MTIKEAVNVLNNNKNYIIKNWIKSDTVNKIIISNNIPLKLFIKEYAIFLYLYYYDVLNNDNFYLEKNISEKLANKFTENNKKITNIYVLHLELINVFKKLLYEKKIFSYEIIEKIDTTFNKNVEYIFSLDDPNKNSDFSNLEIEHTKNIDIIDKNIMLSKLDLDFKYTYVSFAYANLSAYSKNELFGQKYEFLKYKDVHINVYNNVFDSLKNNKVFEGELKLTDKNANEYWIKTLIKPFFNEDKELLYYEEIALDITLKKKFEAQQEFMIEQSKSAAMGEMISMIAHQWRQPLQAISILIQKLPLTKLIDGDISDEVLNQVVEDSNKQLEYMSKTIDDFRDFLRPNVDKEKITLKDLFININDFLAFMLKMDSIKLNISHENEDEILNIHINEVVQVFINLIKNAKDALISNNIEKKEIKIRTFQKNDEIIILVEDNAKGIEEKLLNKIFEAYFTTKSKKNGTGLGLYMSKKIIEQNNDGLIKAYNNEFGAIIEVKFPKSNY